MVAAGIFIFKSIIYTNLARGYDWTYCANTGKELTSSSRTKIIMLTRSFVLFCGLDMVKHVYLHKRRILILFKFRIFKTYWELEHPEQEIQENLQLARNL